jgi:hypothetical protein
MTPTNDIFKISYEAYGNKVEITGSPEGYKQVLDIFKTIGEAIRQIDNKAVAIEKALSQKGITAQEIESLMSDLGVDGIEQVYDEQMKRMNEKQIQSFNDEVYRVEIEALDAGVELDKAQEVSKLLRLFYAIDAKKRNRTMDEIAKDYNWKIIKGEQILEKANKIKEQVKDDVRDLITDILALYYKDKKLIIKLLRN